MRERSTRGITSFLQLKVDPAIAVAGFLCLVGSSGAVYGMATPALHRTAHGVVHVLRLQEAGIAGLLSVDTPSRPLPAHQEHMIIQQLVLIGGWTVCLDVLLGGSWEKILTTSMIVDPLTWSPHQFASP